MKTDLKKKNEKKSRILWRPDVRPRLYIKSPKPLSVCTVLVTVLLIVTNLYYGPIQLYTILYSS